MFARTVGTCAALAMLGACSSEVSTSGDTTNTSGTTGGNAAEAPATFALANYEGGVVIVDLWAVW